MRRDNKIGIYILAAGMSRRMGDCKLLLPFEQSCLLDRAIGVAKECAATEVMVVTGAYRFEMLETISSNEVNELFNPLWKMGQASSVVSVATHAKSRSFEAVLIMVADQPFIKSKHLDALIDAYEKREEWVYLSANSKRRGNPCLFSRECFDLLQNLDGDEGARSLLVSHSDLFYSSDRIRCLCLLVNCR